MNAVDKNVTIPEDIKISDTEPTEEEIMWLDPSENYDFTFDGYSQAQADELFVKKEAGKGLSTKDYTAEDKKKVTNLGSYVSNATGATADANAVAITLEKKDPTTGTADSSAITIDKATTSKAGVMSAADKTKLDGLSNYNDSTITQDITNLKANKLETVEVTGTGNVITAATKNGTKIAFAKGITAMTQDTSDARYVKKSGDVMNGNLKLQGSQLAQIHSFSSGGSASALRFYDVNEEVTYSFGSMITNNGSEYVRTHAYIGWGTSPWEIANNLAVGENRFLYKGNKIWHAGNDGSGSGLEADTLDGYHAGYKMVILHYILIFQK